MLASITPLGERSRGFSWRITVSAFILGATAAGALAGAAAGQLGSLLDLGAGERAGALEAAIVLALLLDATPLRSRLPSTRRQVNEDWLVRYRGWVYGVGFGAQLGLGVVTIVTSAAVYAAAVAAVLCADPSAGLVVGALFGVTRGFTLLAAHSAVAPGELLALHHELARREAPVRRALAVLELLLAILVAVEV